MIKKVAYPRAAVIGNPSDGFFGKTIAFPFSNFHAEARLTESESINIGNSGYANLEAFYQSYKQHGVDAENPLVSASLKRFYRHCQYQKIALHDRGFSIEFGSDIPREVGLAGSSAIITAVIRCLLEYYNVSIPDRHLANLILEVETKEMGISAGLQDRVVQAYESPVYMDFNESLMKVQGYGEYQVLSPDLFQGFYIAYDTLGAEASDVVHNNLRGRFDTGDAQVHQVMKDLSLLTDEFLNALKKGDQEKVAECMNRNFGLRQSICAISNRNLEMITLARSVGASAKFTGSGGAIIGNYKSEEMYSELEKVFASKGIQLFKPTIVNREK